MSRLIAVWIAALLSVAACTTLTYDGNTEPQWFQQVCKLVEQDHAGACEGLTAPEVVESSAPMLLDAYGFYIPGERYVYTLTDALLRQFQELNPTFDVPDMYEVRLHETVHYIADWAGMNLGRCASEALAREVTARWKGLVDDGSWRARYGCGGSVI